MKNLLLLVFLIFNLFACKNGQQKKSYIEQNNKNKINTKFLKDSFKIAETFNQIDQPTNKFLTEKLKLIRGNFKRINSIKIDNWSSVVTKNLDNTNEGGEVTYYHFNNNLDKIITKEYAETFQVMTEYYLLNGELSFVFQKELKYNRPIYYDSLEMKEMNDKEAFHIDKSEIEEYRSYFENGKLISQIGNQDFGSPFSEEYLMKEQKRISNSFDMLIKLEKKNDD